MNFKLRFYKKFFSFFTLISLVFQSLAPYLAVATPIYAQEQAQENIQEEVNDNPIEKPQEIVSEAPIINRPQDEDAPAEVVPAEVVSTPAEEPTPTPTIIENIDLKNLEEIKHVDESATLANNHTPEEVVVEQTCLTAQDKVEPSSNENWNINLDNNSSETKDKVQLGVKYVFPQENNVTLTFTCLPKDESLRTPLKIQQIKVSDLNLPDSINPATEYAYDITTGMQNGTFQYEVTLPKPQDQSAEVSYIEKSIDEAKQEVKADEVKEVEGARISQENDKVKAENLDHFTIYIATKDSDFSTDKTSYAQGEMVYVHATVSDSDANKYYRLVINPPFGGGSNVYLTSCQKISSTVDGAYQLANNAQISSNWKAEIHYFSNSNCSSWGERIEKTATFSVTAASTPSNSCPAPILNTDPNNDIALSAVSGVWTSTTGGSGITGLNTNEVRWGTPASSGDPKSGLRFDGSGSQSFDTEASFYLGTLTHMNWPINSGTAASGAKLKVTLNFSKPTGIISGDKIELSYDFAIEETPNQTPCPAWHTPGHPACDDKVNFPLSYGEERFEYNGKAYTLKIEGFVNNYPSGSPVSEFITEEKKNNCAYLVGKLTSEVLPKADITIIKKTNGEDIGSESEAKELEVGSTVNWSYFVSNTGNVTLTDIAVTDNPSVTIDCGGRTSLVSGESMTCTASDTATAGLYHNIATATGKPPTGSNVMKTDESWYYGVVSNGHLIVQKTTVPSGDQTEFSISATGSGTITGGGSGTVSDSTDHNYEVTPGTYWVTESALEGWEITGNTCNNIEVKAGETKECLITNSKLPKLTLVKKLINDDGGTASVSAWTLKAQKAEGNSISGTSGSSAVTNASVQPGTYTLSESGGPDGYSANAWDCGNKTVKDSAVDLNYGDEVVCTITNDDIQPLLTVTKVVSGGDKVVEDFPLFVGDTSVQSGAQTGFNAGTYTVSETNQSGYASVITGDCDPNGLITLNVGDVKACTITNTRDTGTLRVLKNVDLNGDGDYKDKGEKGATDWQWQHDGETNHNTGDAAITLPTGDYIITETQKEGFHFVELSCKNGQLDGNRVTVDKNANVVCTFKNARDIGTITIVKNAINNSFENFGFTTTGNGWPSTFYLSDSGWGSNSRSFTVPTGDYSVTEKPEKGWALTDLTCNSEATTTNLDARTANITLGAGETITCTFTNTQLAKVWGHKFNDKNENGLWDIFQGEFGLGGWKIFIDQNDNQTYDAGEPYDITSNSWLWPGLYGFEDLMPGDYTFCEESQDLWNNTTPLCQTVTLQPGQNKGYLNFGNKQYGRVVVTKFNDSNQNGVHDEGEGILNGWTINLDKTPLVTGGENQEEGRVVFNNVSQGTYSLSEDLIDGWEQTGIYCDNGSENQELRMVSTPADQQNSFEVNVVAGETNHCYIGNIEKGKVKVYKFNDLNGNGKYDDGESMMSDWEMVMTPLEGEDKKTNYRRRWKHRVYPESGDLHS